MTWLQQKNLLEKKGDRPKRPPPRKRRTRIEKSYSVSEVAEIMSVDRRTVFKWLSISEPDDAVIPPNMWFKLPSGHIRILERAVLDLQNECG